MQKEDEAIEAQEQRAAEEGSRQGDMGGRSGRLMTTVKVRVCDGASAGQGEGKKLSGR